MNVAKEKELEGILNQLSGLLTNKYPSSGRHEDARLFLDCSYNLFLGWRSSLNRIMNLELDEYEFWETFESFCNECQNGSWSGMARHKSEIKPRRGQLYKSVHQMLLARTDVNKVIRIIKNVTTSSGPDKIGGLTAFPMTGILFAYDEENFMILDSPVMDYFGFTGEIEERYYRALSGYGEIIRKSREYSKKFSLPMWYVNKAYGILSNHKHLGVKKLCGNCFGTSFRNFEFPFS
jgi:hypothetical protein